MRHQGRLHRVPVEPGRPEVDDADRARPRAGQQVRVSLHQHVLPVQVAVDDAGAVHPREPVAELRDPGQHQGGVVPVASPVGAGHELGEVEGVDVVTNDVQPVGLDDELVVAQQVRVHRQPDEVVQLPAQQLLVLLEGVPARLHGEDPAGQGVTGPVRHRPVALTQGLLVRNVRKGRLVRREVRGGAVRRVLRGEPRHLREAGRGFGWALREGGHTAVFLLQIPEISIESLDKSSISRWFPEVLTTMLMSSRLTVFPIAQ